MREKPRILHRETIAKTRLFHVEQLDLQFSNGAKARYERLKANSRGAVLIVPVLDAETILLIREYAAGVDRYELAFPKGRVDEGETPESTANRELMEETGYGAERLTHLETMTVAPGYHGHVTHVILAQDLYESRLQGDEPEPVEVVPWKLDRMHDLLAQPDFTEARSIAALYMARDFLDNREKP